jgi:homoserine dehydrogenase
MKQINIALLGCGTVGSGVVKIIMDLQNDINIRANHQIVLKEIVELTPKKASEKYNLPLDIFAGGGKDLSKEEAMGYINKIIKSNEIDIIVETIGGTSEWLLNIILEAFKNKKHVITANKAMLATYGTEIYKAAISNNVVIGYEASVCGAIPVIKSIKEGFTGDEIISISGIMNGTSNYILSKMQEENLDFDEALKLAQQKGYAEADPSFDINGKDAGHKLLILIKLAFGVDIKFEDLSIEGIENISKEDLDFANEMDCNIKLICYAEKKDNKIYACVKPMMVKKSNFLSQINMATNAVQIVNRYSGRHMFVGAGAGSLETASSIVADIVYIARYSDRIQNETIKNNHELIDPKHFKSPYNITFETEDIPGITGLITTAIGNQNINIDTVGHNRHNKEKAVFSVATMTCTLGQINDAIQEIKIKRPEILINKPKVIPILY